MKKVVFLLGCLIVGIGLVMAGDNVAQQLKDIEKLIMEGKSEEALKICQKIITDNPETIEIHRVYQNLMRDLGKSPEVINEYKKRLDKGPDEAIWHYLYGRLLEGEALEKEFARAIELDPKFYWAYCGLGNYYKDQKKWPAAIKALEEAIKIEPDFAQGYADLALLYYTRGELVAAEAIWQKAEKLAPDDLAIKLGLGLCYKALEQYNEAIKVLESVLKQDENYWRVYEPLIQCYYAKKDYPKASILIENLRKLYESSQNKQLRQQNEIAIDLNLVGEMVLITTIRLSSKPTMPIPDTTTLYEFKVWADRSKLGEPQRVISLERTGGPVFELVEMVGRKRCLLESYLQAPAYQEVLEAVKKHLK